VKPWIQRALTRLESSLEPPHAECNELDWKVSLSEDKARLVEHLCAFANHAGGGCLVFGVANNGALVGVTIPDIERITNQLTNLSRAAVEPTMQIDYEGFNFRGVDLLFIYIAESSFKPVHVRGKSDKDTFIRTGSSTRRAERQEVGAMMLHSKTPKWEDLHASLLLTDDEVHEALEIDYICSLLRKPAPTNSDERLRWMSDASFIERHHAGGAYITNLGAITAALDVNSFEALASKPVRVIIYDGLNKSQLRSDTPGRRGYAISFSNLIRYILGKIPTSEVIEEALRRTVPLYPELAIRELIANAIIHQDFSMSGGGPRVEIYADRMEISNPGKLLPTQSVDRLIGTQPEARNEKLSKAFRRYGICEDQGSGLIKAGLQIEVYGLPAIKFQQEPNHFKVTLYAPRSFAQMSAQERLDACYQHAQLKFFSSSTMTNKSLRERLKMPEKQRPMVSALINEALIKALIVPSNPQNKSRKYSEYIPSWAAK